MESQVSQLLHNVKRSLKKKFGSAPYFRVSDGIGSQEQLDGVFTGKHHGYIRIGGHPDHILLEEKIADLIGAHKVRIRSDGMGTIAAAFLAAAALHKRKTKCKGKIKIIIILPVYGGTYDLAKYHMLCGIYDIEYFFLYANDSGLYSKLQDAIDENTAAIFMELAGNPILTLPYVPTIKSIVGNYSSQRPGPVVIVDDTFLFTIVKPFGWDATSADVVVSSATKSLTGESSWSMGFIAVAKSFHETQPDFWQEILAWTSYHGGTVGPFEAYATGQFCITDVKERVAAHSDNAIRVASFLEDHPAIERVIYPGLKSYPWRDDFFKIARPLLGKWRYGAMVSFYIKTHSLETINEFLFYLNNKTHIRNKASLIGPDDSIASPYYLTHKHMSEEDKKRCDITQNLCRLSVGRINPAEKTIEALDRALRAVVVRRGYKVI